MSERASTPLAHRLLGRDVIGGAEHAPGLREPVLLELASDAEVGHLRPALGVDEDVLRLDVAVHEPPRVGGGEPAPDLDRRTRRPRRAAGRPRRSIRCLSVSPSSTRTRCRGARRPRRRRSPRPRSGGRPGRRPAPRVGSARSGRAGRRSRDAGPSPPPSARASRRGPDIRSTFRRCRASTPAGSGRRAPSRSVRRRLLSSHRSFADYFQPSRGAGLQPPAPA